MGLRGLKLRNGHIMGGEGLMERVEMLSQGLRSTALMAPSRFGDVERRVNTAVVFIKPS